MGSVRPSIIALGFALLVVSSQVHSQDKGNGKDTPAAPPAPFAPAQDKATATDKSNADAAIQAAQDAVDIASKRDAKFKQLGEELLKSIDQLPRGPVDLKAEIVVWDKLDLLVPHLIDENRWLVAQFPKFQDEHKLLVAAFDRAIDGCHEAAKVCEADAQAEKEDARKEEYLQLASISKKAADRLRQRAQQAGIRKTEMEKLVQEAAKDVAYFGRLAQVIKLVKMPLQQEVVADEFVKRVRRYYQNREQLRKILRNLSEKLDPYPTPTQVAPKVSTSDLTNYPSAAREQQARSKAQQVSVKAPAPADPESEHLYREGLRAQSRRDFSEAERLFRRAIARHRGTSDQSAPYRIALAQVLLK